MRTPFWVPLLAVSLAGFASPAFSQTIPANTPIAIRLDQNVSSKKAAPNQRVRAKVAEDVVVNGEVLIPKGNAASVYVEKVQKGGSAKPAALWLRLDAIEVNGRAYPIFARSAGKELSTEAAASVIRGDAFSGKLKKTSESKDDANRFVDVSEKASDTDSTVDPNEVDYPSATILNFQLKEPVKLK